ncbi:hypothetical protein BC831DRAFT_443139 [Entophlyctis helioformis]|nr:hypothetical protein BC831DRAFT_443139 [Entophlyctis helioformis]
MLRDQDARSAALARAAQDAYNVAHEQRVRDMRVAAGEGRVRLTGGGRVPLFSDEELDSAGDMDIVLVPIRLDVEIDGIKLRDTFTWNQRDKIVSPETFARILCSDLRLPSTFVEPVAKSIRDQLDDHYQHAPIALAALDSQTRGRQQSGSEAGEDDAKKVDDAQDALDEEDLPELRTVIKLDITVDNQTIVDQFEWDMGCRRNCPERFAEHLVTELGLVPEFKTAISHAIREQVQSLANGNWSASASGGASGVIRSSRERHEYGPFMSYASTTELERIEKDFEKDTKRKRRQTQRSRRTVSLPDREAHRTHRTPVPNAVRFESHAVIDPLLQADQAFGGGGGGGGASGIVPAYGPGSRARRKASMSGGGSGSAGSGAGSGSAGGDTDTDTDRAWRCVQCGTVAADTCLVRRGPSGAWDLCNNCGLDASRRSAGPHHAHPPHPPTTTS